LCVWLPWWSDFVEEDVGPLGDYHFAIQWFSKHLISLRKNEKELTAYYISSV